MFSVGPGSYSGPFQGTFVTGSVRIRAWRSSDWPTPNHETKITISNSTSDMLIIIIGNSLRFNVSYSILLKKDYCNNHCNFYFQIAFHLLKHTTHVFRNIFTIRIRKVLSELDFTFVYEAENEHFSSNVKVHHTKLFLTVWGPIPIPISSLHR